MLKAPLNLSSLREIFKPSDCSHEYPNKFTLVDLIGRKEEHLRAYFCLKCDGYKWKKVENESWAPEVISELRKDKYHVYFALDKLHFLREQK